MGPYMTLVLHQGAQASNYVHSLNIIHQDIKPGNFLLDHNIPPNMKLTDFRHSTRSRTSRDHTKGTIAYHAPEISALKEKEKESQCRKEEKEGQRGKEEKEGRPRGERENQGGVWSEKSDAFSFGVLAFKLIHGRFKRPDFHIDKKLHKWLIEKLEESSTALSDFSKTLISWNPNDRPTLQQVLLYQFWPDPETPFSDHKRRYLV
jgi:serine/threonine protein kinase